MRKTIFAFCALVCLAFIAPLALADEEEYKQEVYLTKKQALAKAFPGADKIDREKIWLTDTQRQAIGKIIGETVEDRRISFYAGRKNGKTVLKLRGPLYARNVAGHTSSPSVADFNRDGIPDLLVGAEDGRLYYAKQNRE